MSRSQHLDVQVRPKWTFYAFSGSQGAINPRTGLMWLHGDLVELTHMVSCTGCHCHRRVGRVMAARWPRADWLG